jgi:hypothetical protein
MINEKPAPWQSPPAFNNKPTMAVAGSSVNNNENCNNSQGEVERSTEDESMSTSFSSILPAKRLKTLQSSDDDAASGSTQSEMEVVANVLSPETRRQYSYPLDIPGPSRDLVQDLFIMATSDEHDDPARIAKAGLLSLEKVILPAVCHSQNAALKRVQAVIQRDGKMNGTTGTDHQLDKQGQIWKDHFVACRQAVHDATAVAMHAVAENRVSQRIPAEERRIKEEWEPAQQEQVRTKEEKARQAREAARVAATQRWPQNQAAWREIAYLMTERAKLLKDEKQWHKSKEAFSEERDKEVELLRSQETPVVQDANSGLPEGGPSARDKVNSLAQTVEAISISTKRIQRALHEISNVVTESDDTRKELYHRYTRDYQFRRYPGVHDAHGLLKALSQSSPLASDRKQS